MSEKEIFVNINDYIPKSIIDEIDNNSEENESNNEQCYNNHYKINKNKQNFYFNFKNNDSDKFENETTESSFNKNDNNSLDDYFNDISNKNNKNNNNNSNNNNFQLNYNNSINLSNNCNNNKNSFENNNNLNNNFNIPNFNQFQNFQFDNKNLIILNLKNKNNNNILIQTFLNFINMFNIESFNKNSIYYQKIFSQIPLSIPFLDLIIQKLQGNFSNLMQGNNSNYFISDLIKKCTKKQKIIILNEIFYNIDNLSLNEYSNHCIQTLIEKASSKEEIILIINSLSHNKEKVLEICKNEYGSFVIQKILTYFNENYRYKINEIILNNLYELCIDMYGVCVVKKFINNTNNQIYSNILIKNIFINFYKIAKNNYGNYAIQNLIDKFYKNENFMNYLLNLIFYNNINNFLDISINRFGSHIVEYIISKLGKSKKKKIFLDIYNNISNGNLIIKTIYFNKYGKYVINKLLIGFEFEEKNYFIMKLNQNNNYINKNNNDNED